MCKDNKMFVSYQQEQPPKNTETTLVTMTYEVHIKCLVLGLSLPTSRPACPTGSDGQRLLRRDQRPRRRFFLPRLRRDHSRCRPWSCLPCSAVRELRCDVPPVAHIRVRAFGAGGGRGAKIFSLPAFFICPSTTHSPFLGVLFLLKQ